MSNIVLVGAGGAGMSGVAGILWELGFKNIVVIDVNHSQLLDNLEKMGMKVFVGHGKYEVEFKDAVIYSSAAINSPEVLKAKSFPYEVGRNRIVFDYFEFLGEISKYFRTVGITGTNGKSTSTSLAIFAAQKFVPDFGLGIVGALVSDFGNKNYVINKEYIGDIRNIFEAIFTSKEVLNYDLIKKYYFFVEACEYCRHFLCLDVDYSIITNVTLDHLDYYKDEADYFSAFSVFANKTKKKVFILKDEKISSKISIDDESKICEVDTKIFDFKYIFGEHQNLNGSLVEALLFELGSKEEVKKYLEEFRGLWRRMELLGENTNGALIYSDYGHVAESIGLGYKALKSKYNDKKLFLIFQPHQIRRVVEGRDDFIKAAKDYDNVIIYDIYAARESLDLVKTLGIDNIETLKDFGDVFANKCGGEYITSFDELKAKIDTVSGDYVICIFTAGDLDYKVRNGLIFGNKKI